MIDIFEKAALEAGRAIMQVYESRPNVVMKDDASPVTEADERAEAIIFSHLSAALPNLPVVAEEAVASGDIPVTEGGRFILVDPLDGTKEFISHRSDFTVNIALIENRVPVAGFVYAPAKQVAYSGSPKGAEKLSLSADHVVIDRTSIRTRLRSGPPVAVASRSHNNAQTETFLESNAVTDIKSVGSSLKFCMLAESQADVYPRYGRTMEWDTAAGDAVLRAAGGMTLDLDGRPLSYNKRNQAGDSDFANPFFIAWGTVRPGGPFK